MCSSSSVQAGGSFTINGATFTSPTVPVLLQILSGAQSAGNLLPAGSVFTLPGDSTIEISMPAGVAGGPHPFHLHGVSSLNYAYIPMLTNHSLARFRRCSRFR